MPRQAEAENTLQVFSNPQQHIEFYADDPTSYKQILSIINPYQFSIKFRIFSTDCSKYAISGFSGIIKPHHSSDLVVQHKAVFPANFDVTDKFRIQVYTPGHHGNVGRKDITLVLKNTKPRDVVPVPAAESERFQQVETDSESVGHLQQVPPIPQRSYLDKLIYAFLIAGLVTVLLIPNVGDDSSLPDIFLMIRPTCEVKIFISFTLGFILSYIFCKYF